jgi:tyrosyl-tRNA synthetase
MIGDPGGRSEERNLLDEDALRGNVAAIKSQISRVLGDEGEWQLVDNYEWTRDIPLLAFLRDVGKHVTVNQMTARESVRTRLESEHGISYTEFSYMLLQAFDYWWLHEHHGCELQIGGSDQWGNILSGVDLIRRRSGVAVHALCWPLLLAADGTKLGKTTGARVWLDPELTSPYQLFQHFVQTDDRQVGQQLRWLTLLPVPEIEEVMRRHAETPQQRGAQRVLAREVVTLVHGSEAAEAAEAATEALFGQSTTVSPEHIAVAVEMGAPTINISAGRLAGGVQLLDLLVESQLAKSKTQAKHLADDGGAYVNDVPAEADRVLTPDDLTGDAILLRRGKSSYAVIRIAG